MMKDLLIEELCEMRMSHAFEMRLQQSRAFQETEQECSQCLDRVLQLATTEEQRSAIDDMTCAYNANGAQYGKEAYMHGFNDGAKLLLELQK